MREGGLPTYFLKIYFRLGACWRSARDRHLARKLARLTLLNDDRYRSLLDRTARSRLRSRAYGGANISIGKRRDL